MYVYCYKCILLCTYMSMKQGNEGTHFKVKHKNYDLYILSLSLCAHHMQLHNPCLHDTRRLVINPIILVSIARHEGGG